LNREVVQFWLNSLNDSAGVLKKRPDAFILHRSSQKIFFVVIYSNNGGTNDRKV